jgi:hypothetical protein
MLDLPPPSRRIMTLPIPSPPPSYSPLYHNFIVYRKKQPLLEVLKNIQIKIINLCIY